MTRFSLFAFARIPCGLSKIPDFERGRRDDQPSHKATARHDGGVNRADLSRRSPDEDGSSLERTDVAPKRRYVASRRRRRVGYGAIPLDTPPLVEAKRKSRFIGAVGSFILKGLPHQGGRRIWDLFHRSRGAPTTAIRNAADV
jgi:hypothetical protein